VQGAVVEELIEQCAAAVQDEVFPGVKAPSAQPITPVVAEDRRSPKKKKKKVGWVDLGPRQMVEVFPGVWLPVGENQVTVNQLVQDVLFFEKGSAAADVYGLECAEGSTEEMHEKARRRLAMKKVMSSGLLTKQEMDKGS